MKRFPSYSKIMTPDTMYPQRSSTMLTILYLLFCVSIVAIIILSTIFTVDISISSPGVIRPSAEISPVRSAVSGRIKKLFINENQFVRSGDTLYSIESEGLAEREKYLLTKLDEATLAADDLRKLTAGKTNITGFHTPVFLRSWLTYLQKLEEANVRYAKARRDYARNHRLHSEKVIADAEFETYKFELDRTHGEVVLIARTQMSQWQNELNNYEKEHLSIESELNQVRKEANNLIIRSPISGTIQNLAGIYTGSIVIVNQDIAQISPDSNLIVEAYVSPNNIGLLLNNMKVKFQVDAFNYNQWGLVEGNIIDISNDIHGVNDKPVFIVRCALARNYVQLKSGYKGILKKGMSLRARFVITERTLWQLLYDKMDDWLNPVNNQL